MIKDFLNFIAPIKNILKRSEKIDSLVHLKEFIKERSAYVSQSTLYGYLKTRMGTRYVSLFEDENILQSINIAKNEIYIQSIQDLTLYSLHHLKTNLNSNEFNKAINIYQEILENDTNIEIIDGKKNQLVNQFNQIISHINWDIYIATNEFEKSCEALYKWAPVADELKILDREIILNSMFLKWKNIKVEFKKLINI
jgi:hypothetical protein|tara:strand:- start:43 stop:633 length:591 start_codon:yes stop_codon:yes gene_type:complete